MSCQCEGKTKAGVRCTKRTLHESKRCHFHREAPVTTVVEVAPVPQVTAEPIGKNTKTMAPKPVEKPTKPVLSERCCDKIECCVCMEEMPGSDKLDCGHPLCRECVGNLRSDKCPLCRRDIKAKHITSKQKADMRRKLQEDRVARNSAATQAFIQQDLQQANTWSHNALNSSALISALSQTSSAATHQAFLTTILNLFPYT
jgi:hypothetical protein